MLRARLVRALSRLLAARPGPSASVYVGFAAADGRPRIIAVQSSVALAFVVVAAAAIIVGEIAVGMRFA